MFFVFIFALTSLYRDQIIAGLVKKGYVVSPAAKNAIIITQENSGVIDLLVNHMYNSDLSSEKLLDDLRVILNDELKAKFHGLVITNGKDTRYSNSNFSLIEPDLQLVSNNKSNLN